MKNYFFALCIAMLSHQNQARASEAGMPQLNPEFWAAQIFWLLIIFSILYLIIWKIFLPKITISIENRKSKIVNDLSEAQKLKERAEKKLQEYKKVVEDAKKEAKKIIEESNKTLALDLEKNKQKINDQIEKELLKAEQEIKNLNKTSISKINKIAEDVSGEIIKQIIDIEINKSSVSAIVETISKREMEKHL